MIFLPEAFHWYFDVSLSLIGSPPFQLGIGLYCIEPFLVARAFHRFHKEVFLCQLVSEKRHLFGDVKDIY